MIMILYYGNHQIMKNKGRPHLASNFNLKGFKSGITRNIKKMSSRKNHKGIVKTWWKKVVRNTKYKTDDEL